MDTTVPISSTIPVNIPRVVLVVGVEGVEGVSNVRLPVSTKEWQHDIIIDNRSVWWIFVMISLLNISKGGCGCRRLDNGELDSKIGRAHV